MLNSFSPLLAFFLWFFLVQQVCECSKGLVGNGIRGFFTDMSGFIRHFVSISPMLVVVAINAEIFPVAPVRRIVVVIVILVMDREQVEIFTGEVSAAAGTYPGMDLKRLLAVAFHSLFFCLAHPLSEFGQFLAS